MANWLEIAEYVLTHFAPKKRLTIIVYESVGPFVHEDDPDMIYYRSCDFCFQSAVEDIWAGKREHEWRRFYRLSDGGEIACDNCLPDVEHSEVAPDRDVN